MRTTVDNFRPFSLRKRERRKSSPVINPYLFWGKRKSERRGFSKQSLYVDQFTNAEYLLVFGVLFLAILDGVFTGIHLANGASEINPILNFFFKSYGLQGLLTAKFAITIPCLFFILIHIRFQYALTGAKFLVFIYSALNVYHLVGFTIS